MFNCKIMFPVHIFALIPQRIVIRFYPLEPWQIGKNRTVMTFLWSSEQLAGTKQGWRQPRDDHLCLSTCFLLWSNLCSSTPSAEWFTFVFASTVILLVPSGDQIRVPLHFHLNDSLSSLHPLHTKLKREAINCTDFTEIVQSLCLKLRPRQSCL